MPYTHEYALTRNLITTADGTKAWDTDRPDRLDANGNQVRLAKEIEAAFPGWPFKLAGNNGTLLVCSNEPCPNPVTLETVVTDHQNNVPLT